MKRRNAVCREVSNNNSVIAALQVSSSSSLSLSDFSPFSFNRFPLLVGFLSHFTFYCLFLPSYCLKLCNLLNHLLKLFTLFNADFFSFFFCILKFTAGFISHFNFDDFHLISPPHQLSIFVFVLHVCL